MGDSKSINRNNTESVDGGRKSKYITAIVLLLGLFAPFLLMISYYGFDSQIILIAIVWSLFSSPSVFPYSSRSYRFEILPPEIIIQLFPLILLRLVPVSQIYRYYQGKTTRRRALIASTFGEGIYMFYLLLMVIMTFASGLITIVLPIPIPFQFLFCSIVLWRYPIPKPTTPWDGKEKSKSWWEKGQEPKEEKLRKEDELW